MNKIIKSIVKIKEVLVGKLECFLGVFFALQFILIDLKIKNVINISWLLAIMPLMVFMIIMGTYLVLFFIDEIKYQKEIRKMKRR